MDQRSPKQIVHNIFQYDDYRHFLSDWFAAKTAEKPAFSHRAFAARAGFKAHNFCSLVIAGKRNLSEDSIRKIVKAVGLRGREASFFENLVYLNQAETLDDKEHYFSQLKRIGSATRFYRVNQDQFFFYEKWYYPVVRELMVLADWHDDPAILAKMVRPFISSVEAAEAVALLLRTNMVQKTGPETYALTNEFVTSQTVPEYIKKKARQDVLLKGIETVDSIEPAEKYAAYATVTLSKKLYTEIKGMLDETRAKIHALVAEDKPADEVYEVVFQVFPVSNLQGRTKRTRGAA